jgi:hemolysin activation/secretion protein
MFPLDLSAHFAARLIVGVGLIGISMSSVVAQEISTLTIREYRVEGAKRLPRLEVEEAVYPYLGPGRTPGDVDAARAALEKCYHDKGFETVSVIIPSQDPRRGIIRLEVVEGKVGRLRVKGAKWYLPSAIRRDASSVAEGQVPEMNRVKKDILALNRLADRRVTPVLRAGIEPGTVDIDLNVEDKLPLHGSLELNNRNSANTSGLRLNGSLSYANLFQLGHTLGLDFQVAPQNTNDAKVFSGRYLLRVSDGLSLMLQASKQDSDISTLGNAAVVGRGHSAGLTAMFDLPVTEHFYQNFSLAMDYRHSAENIIIGKDTIASPIEYYPISASYGASWLGEKAFTEFNSSLNFHLRGLGSNELDYSNKRYNADGNYVYLRSDLARTQDFKGGSQLFGKIQSQLASQPLISSDQISGGGLGTVRGYLESAAPGDNGIFSTLEYRTQTLVGKAAEKKESVADEWRFHLFTEAGLVGIWNPLPGQQKRTGLASVGAGTRFKINNHFNGSLDLGVPLISQTGTPAGTPRLTFRSWAEF